MTLPHHTALARDSERRPDSVAAAEAHARGHRRSFGRITWTPWKVAPLVVLLASGVGVLVGAVLLVVAEMPAPYTTDPSTPRGAVGAYFDALEKEDVQSAADLLCESDTVRLALDGFLHATAESVPRSPVEPWPVLLGDASRLGGGTYAVEVIDGDRESSFIRVVEEGDGQYRVCGFA